MRGAIVCLPLLVAAAAASADTVVLKSGKKLEGGVHEEGGFVVVNPYNSRCPEMTWGITDKDRIPADKVAQTIVEEAPLTESRERASKPGLSAEEHVDLAKWCEAHKLPEEREREFKLALCLDPGNSEALASIGRGAWQAWAKGNPLADPDLQRLEREYVKMDKPAELDAQWDQMTAKATTRPRSWLERARRSAKLPLGRRDKVPLTLRSEVCPGATYAIYVPTKYDPLVPTGLVLGLHGGGPGSKTDATVVTGSGESALDFYVDVGEERGFIVVCPTALEAGWGGKRNEPLIDAVLEEMRLIFNVDENRVYLTGHSMGGGGAWVWGPKRAEVWAAFSPCAGWGGPDTGGVPVYIYHGTDDQIVGVQSDRTAADVLLKDKKADFVYTEIDKVGHGFPDFARKDIFRFFAGRWRDDGKRRADWPRSSFDRKVTKDEVKCFGDPSVVAAPDAGDAKVSTLVADLEKGGGRGVEAARELAAHKDAKTVAAVARVLHSKKAATDARALAARTIGDIGLPEGVKALAAEAACEDFRVLEAVAEALGRLGGRESVDPLVRAAKQFGALWDRSGSGGEFVFTEYETRCRSFAIVCDAIAAAGVDAAAAFPVLDKEIAARVYTPKSPYTVPIDDRFVTIPPRARLTLMKSLRACLVKLKDPRGKALLASIKAAWAKEAAIVQEAEAGIGELG